MSLFKSKKQPTIAPVFEQPFGQLSEAFLPKIEIIKSNVIYNKFNISNHAQNATIANADGLVCESAVQIESLKTAESAVFIWVHFKGAFSDDKKTLEFDLSQKFKINRTWSEPDQIPYDIKPYLHTDIYNLFVNLFNVVFPQYRLTLAATTSGVAIRAAIVED